MRLGTPQAIRRDEQSTDEPPVLPQRYGEPELSSGVADCRSPEPERLSPCDADAELVEHGRQHGPELEKPVVVLATLADRRVEPGLYGGRELRRCCSSGRRHRDAADGRLATTIGSAIGAQLGVDQELDRLEPRISEPLEQPKRGERSAAGRTVIDARICVDDRGRVPVVVTVEQAAHGEPRRRTPDDRSGRTDELEQPLTARHVHVGQPPARRPCLAAVASKKDQNARAVASDASSSTR